jgi:NAD(P)-dependent dehydrogenase (short-subunit alcohol dehydrogenase family)
MSDKSNEGRVAIVTGASQGIGAGIVRTFRDLGYRVVANSRSIKPSSDPDVAAVPGDISEQQTARRVAEEAVRRFSRIDVLVNNAGIFVAKPFTDYTVAEFTSVLETNVAGFFYITQFAIAEMLRRRSGHVVNITATLADHPNSKVPAVMASVTKGGLNSATKALAIEYAAHGIRVNAVSPGNIKTPMHPPQTHEALAKAHPVGRMGEVQDIVDAVVFLDSASFVTGEILHVDGGQSAGR